MVATDTATQKRDLTSRQVPLLQGVFSVVGSVVGLVAGMNFPSQHDNLNAITGPH
jgi:hypothetical protein